MKRFFFMCRANLFIFFALVGACGFWLRSHWIRNIQESSCQSNLKQIALGMFMYAQDYDDKFPPAVFHDKTVGWANGLQPYLRSYGIFQCPIETHPAQKTPQPDKPGFTDYWMNSNLSRLDLNKVNNLDKIIMFGDGDGGAPESTASYAIDRLPVEWRNLSDSPARRHHGGANYAFLDGGVKWLKPEQIAQVPPLKKSQFHTFLVK